MADLPPQLYAKRLLPLAYGYPLWTPEPSHGPVTHARDGLRIGDVGVIDVENGSFDVFFNVCLSRDHPLHRATGVPDNFVPIELDESDIASFPHSEHPGQVLSTPSVTTNTTPPSDAPLSCPSTYDFNLSSAEGAILVLPMGAESCHLRKRQLFGDVAIRNATQWYIFAKRHLGRVIPNDALYLITGLYKASAWSVAVFPQQTESSARFKVTKVEENNDLCYTWETTRALDWRAGRQADAGMPNQSVFISGFKIAIREDILGEKSSNVEVNAPPIRSRSAKFSRGEATPSLSEVRNIWRRIVSRGSAGGSRKHTGELADSQKQRRRPFSLARNSGNKTHGGVASSQGFHLSDAINRYILSKASSVNVAITHDSQWCALFEKGTLKSEDFDNDRQLESILEDFRISLREGAGYLQTNSEWSIQLTDIDDSVRVALSQDMLDDAEEMLSRRPIRPTGHDHFALAIRALIRARLRNWIAALRDAEMSIDVRPSVVGYIARGFSLFGQEKYDLAVGAFNVALRQCDVCDRDLVLLIKFVVLFEIGYHSEGLAGVAGVSQRCPAETKSSCSCVQAEMYIRLATLASKSGNYDRALQHLTRAQSLWPFHAICDLQIISLMCGWRFDCLLFNIFQRKCETLHVSGRINEAVESFRTMMCEVGEDERTRSGNAAWIASFTQQCMRSLEWLGDDRMASRNYAEAITFYTTALSMDPASGENILIKRNEAYAVTQMWNDASKVADEINLDPRSHLGLVDASQHISRHGNESLPENQNTTSTSGSFSNTLHHRFNDGSASGSTTVAWQPSEIQMHSSFASDVVRLEGEKVGNRVERDLGLRSFQLAGLAAHITAVREQLGSGVITIERDQALDNQLSNTLKTLMQADRGVTTLGEDDQTRVEAPGSLCVSCQAQTVVFPNQMLRPPISSQQPNAHVHPSINVSPGSLNSIHQPIVTNLPNMRSVISEDTCSIDAIPPNKDEDRLPRRRPGAAMCGVLDVHIDDHSRRYHQPGELIRSSDSDDSVEVHKIEGANAPSFDSQSDLGNLISTWQGIIHQGDPSMRAPSVDTSSNSMVTDMLPRERDGTPERSSRNSRSISEAPWLFEVPASATNDVRLHRPGTFTWLPTHDRTRSNPISHARSPVHDTLLEILKEERLARRASIEQQQELMKQIRNMNEWLMKEMQDRLSELRGMAARPHSCEQRPGPGEPSHSQTQFYHGNGMGPPNTSASMASGPWTVPWFPPPATSFNATSYGATSFGNSLNPSSQAPVIPPMLSPPQHTPFIPPEPIVYEFGAPRGYHERVPLAGNPRVPLPAMTLAPSGSASGPEPTPSQPQTSIKAPTLGPKSLLLGFEGGAPVAVGTAGQTSASGPSPVSAISAGLGMPDYDSPKKPMSEVGDESDNMSAEKRRPGMVTFGDITYI